MVIIQDGKGGGKSAEVNKENQLVVSAIVQSEIEHESETNGASYTWSSDSVNIDANDTVLLVKNTSDTPLHIVAIQISGSTTSEYTVHLPTTEVTVTGVTVTGVNLNTTSSNVADASAASDETNNSQGDVIRSVHLLAETTLSVLVPGLIIGKNKSIAIDVVADTALSSVSIIGHYQD